MPAPDRPYDQRLAALGEWARQSITNRDAKQLANLTDLAANKDALAKAIAKVGIAQCQLLDNRMELQSFADAMKVVCDGADKDPAYFKSHALNAEVARLVTALGEANTADARQRLREAATRAGLTTCALWDQIGPLGGMPVPTVPDVGLNALITPSFSIVITPTGVVAEGKTIVAVEHGDVDPAEKQGGVLGALIPRLRDFMKALAAQGGNAQSAITLVVDPTTTSKLLIEVMFSVKAAGFRTFALAVHAGTSVKAIPLELPDKAAPGSLSMVVTVSKDHLILWSMSGQEGTLQKPKLQVMADRVADLQRQLAEIADRRWHGGKRADIDRQITAMFDSTTPVQTVAAVLASVRAAADGTELFPDVRLSSGFE